MILSSACTDELLENELAQENADIDAIRAVGTCFTNGIDTLITNADAGTALWNSCFTEDHSFEFTGEVPGTGMVATVSCPGESCPAPAPQVGAGPRAAFAAQVFQQAGYVATQHLLVNVKVDVDGDTAILRSDLIAYHFRADDGIDVFNGKWESDLVRIDERWLSSHEKATQTSFVTMPGTPLGEGTARDREAVRELANCYTDGIDRIGGGDLAGGTSIWSSCYTSEFSWDFDFGPFGMFECPGQTCPAPAPGTGAEPRAAFADSTFSNLGYTATQHQVTNISVDVDVAKATSVLNADLTAFHFLPDGAIDLFNGTISLTAILDPSSGWKIAHESGVFTSFVRLNTEPIPSP